jgi:HSP20 family protein
VTFHRLSDDRSRVMLQIEYEPKTWTESLGDLLGVLSHRIENDLQRFKEFIESRQQPTGAWRGQIPSPDDRSRPAHRSQEQPPARRDSFGFGSSSRPFGFMRRFAEEMDRLFEDFGFGSEPFSSGIDRSTWNPHVDVSRRGDKLFICADLPGLREQDVDVEIEDRMLVIRGERQQDHELGEGKFQRRECRYGSFYRAIELPDDAQVDKASATFRNGVLEIAIPASAAGERRGRRIAIQGSAPTDESARQADTKLNKSA